MFVWIELKREDGDLRTVHEEAWPHFRRTLIDDRVDNRAGENIVSIIEDH